ncbi:MAG: AgmX/PglI C-terminal domain-containing protein [Chitinispirillaceae bacterium]|nr:AgmX/PglI C-terminal domain-containing protein [Chitinispirillaceae bacterium]
MNRTISTLSFILFTILVSCQNEPGKERFFITGKGDTLTGHLVAMLDPGEKADSIRYRNVLVRLGLTIDVENRMPDSFDSLLADQLSLESGVEWSIQAANLLYDAAHQIRTKLGQAENCSATVAFAESLFQIVNTEKSYSFPEITVNPPDKNRIRWISVLFSELFNLDGPTATALAVFTSEQHSEDNQKLQQSIKGLLFDSSSTTNTIRKISRTKKAPRQNNEKNMLKLRNQESILDTITRHIPEIRALYKKHLKRNENIRGTIKVTFNLAPTGKVLEVSVAKTDIVDSGFLDPLLNYLKLIKFKSIPAEAGTMKFEFPFEFDRDM